MTAYCAKCKEVKKRCEMDKKTWFEKHSEKAVDPEID